MGSYHNLALKADGTVVAWGDDFAGQVDVPEGLSNVVAVTAGQFHSVALRSDGQVVAWGDNGYGQTNVPAGLSGVKAISAGISFTLALRSNGTMTAWGQVPQNQPALSDVVAVSAGNGFALALRSNGRVASWGFSSASQTNVPAGLSNVVAVSAGWFHCAALKNDGKVVVWGVTSSVASGTLAIPTGLKNVISIATAEQGTYALVLDPKLSTIRRAGSNVVLGFRSFLGQAYQIQYSTDLAPNSWFNLPGGNVGGTGTNLEVTDSNVLPGQPTRFYRLVEVN
jgi:alpha-tubulin suppressor-like RCC1 family protein